MVGHEADQLALRVRSVVQALLMGAVEVQRSVQAAVQVAVWQRAVVPHVVGADVLLVARQGLMALVAQDAATDLHRQA